MALKLQDDGIKQKLLECAANWNAANLHLHLMTSNTTPTTSTTLGSLTEPGGGSTWYSPQNAVTWGAAVVAAHVATMTCTAITFTHNGVGGSVTIYGYYVTDNANSLLFWCERDAAAPITLTNNGDSYTITLKLTDESL